MSGIISGGGGDDILERYNQRLNELTQKSSNKSLATSISGNLSESTANGQYFNSIGQTTNGTLTTDQFYKKSSNEGHQIRAESIPSTRLLMDGSSTYTGASDTFVFKKPMPVKRFNSGPRKTLGRRLHLLMDCILNSDEDKQTLKFTATAIEILVHAVMNPPVQPVNPVHLIEHVSQLVKEEYLSKRVPKSICGSSVMSDQSSTIDQYTGNSERSVRLDRPTGIGQSAGLRVALQDITQSSMYSLFNRPGQNINSEYSSVGLSFNPQQETSTSRRATNNRSKLSDIDPTLTGSTFNLLNDSEIAQRRDEAAANQSKACNVTVIPKRADKKVIKATPKPATNSSKMVIKATPKPAANSSKVGRRNNELATANKKPSLGHSKVSAPVLEKSAIEHGNKNISILNGTASGISRSGRILKPPVKYWNSKGDEVSWENIDESVLNESMTLRNKKILDKKKTPPLRSNKKNTPTITENEVSVPTKKPRGRPAFTQKEIKAAEKKKPATNPTETPVVKTTSSKSKANKKKEEVINKNTEKAEKKTATKRKSKEPNDVLPKKKKVEELADYSDIEDDIFGATTYKKPTNQNLKVAVSPSAALLSAKKAAGEAQGKATPPCKAISDMMVNESIRSTMSAGREAPKQNEAVKRIIKKMDKEKMNAPTQSKGKTQAKKNKKENSQLNDLMEAAKCKYTVSNPVSSATITTFWEPEQDSYMNDIEEEDDEDLM